MQQIETKKLKELTHNVRRHIIKMSTGGGAFTGAALSCADFIPYLYTHFLNVNKSNLKDPERDYFFLSKGHVVPVLYGLFAETGILEPERLNNHLKANDDIYWHPNVNVPGIEFHSGSLGHGLPVAAGVAKEIKLSGGSNKVVVVTGDGELNEGSNWEALLVAISHKLDNLIVVVDRNHFQANFGTEELIPIEPLDKKFETFGAVVTTVDGHDFEKLHYAFSNLDLNSGKVNVVLCDTVRGKGLPSHEAKANRWFVNFNAEQLEEALAEFEENYQKEGE